MADIVNQFESVLISYEDVRREHPTWSDIAIEDYMARLRDMVRVAEKTTTIESDARSSTNALLFKLQQRIGSGDTLTVDDTGFTADNTHLTVDRTEY